MKILCEHPACVKKAHLEDTEDEQAEDVTEQEAEEDK